MKDFPCLFIYHKKKVNFEENHFKCEPINPPGCLSLQGTKFCRDMKKNLLVAFVLCLSYGFSYSHSFDKPINQTAKMSNFEMDSFTTKNGKSLKITFFKHAAYYWIMQDKKYSLILFPIMPTIHNSRRRISF